MKDRIKQFLAALEARNFGLNTIRSYERSLEEFCDYADNLAVRKIQRKHVRGFIRHLGDRQIAGKSIRLRMAAVKSFLRWLHVESVVPANVSAGVSIPRGPRDLPDVPSEADIRKLLDGELKTPFPERDLALLELLYATGIRVSEACGIMPEDFEAPDVVIVRGKGKRERRVLYGERARAALDVYRPLREKMLAERPLTDLVKPAFFLSFGPCVGLQGLNVRSVGRLLKQAASVKGLDATKYHPHILRHCFSKHCHDNGMPVEVVSKLLGHAKLSTTVTYMQVSTARMMQTYNKAHPHGQGESAMYNRPLVFTFRRGVQCCKSGE